MFTHSLFFWGAFISGVRAFVLHDCIVSVFSPSAVAAAALVVVVIGRTPYVTSGVCCRSSKRTRITEIAASRCVQISVQRLLDSGEYRNEMRYK